MKPSIAEWNLCDDLESADWIKTVAFMRYAGYPQGTGFVITTKDGSKFKITIGEEK